MTRGDELPRHMIPDSEWPRFLQATVAEWAAILDTSAVTIISPAAARDIRKHLSHRIVPSRHVYREKPGEGVGTVSKAKCRWCVLGHRDPDIRQLERSSPTPQTSSIYTFLFVAAVLQREVTLGDLKSAFMQSDKDVSERSQGQLYASLPPGGIPLADGTWVEEGSLVQLNAAVYGLVNAPSAWRKTIVRGIENLGYRRSCYDPCIFCLMNETGPQGHILIEVPLTGMRFTLRTWQSFRRPSSLASGRAYTTVRVTTPAERSYRIICACLLPALRLILLWFWEGAWWWCLVGVVVRRSLVELVPSVVVLVSKEMPDLYEH